MNPIDPGRDDNLPTVRLSAGTTLSHINIIARDPERLAAFYIEVFGCVPSPPERQLEGDWLGQGMGLPGARVKAMHLRLPGEPVGGATLELFKLDGDVSEGDTSVNSYGWMHIAFNVDDIRTTFERAMAAGGAKLGEITYADVPGVGQAEFVYTRDPEGNVVELQQWKSRG
jgi:predicted enzyme related to lactoylglutathione lyase